ncbi:CP family cyanate transporter-like MFS transporter [Microvirga subterranea]|uniref:CP family cyanate transporter-like MFS transporter n=1 Tax=Microvirga subterranea TaxID=186651 RepID=A0A370HGB3_9HYPH|nr:CP family cyanate transporter-like MFS transporter [Microvirga subterranea]
MSSYENRKPSPRPPPQQTLRVGSFVALCLVVAAFNLRPALTGLATLLTEVQNALALNSFWTGALTTAPVLCFGLTGPFAPLLASRLGLERAICLLFLLLAASLGLRALSHPSAMAASTLAAGAAIGMAGVLLPVVIRRDFPNRLGLMTGLYTMVLSVGGASAAGLTPMLERASGSWTTALAAWSIPAVIAAILWGILARASVATIRSAKPTRFAALMGDRVAWSVTAFMGLQAGLAFVVLGWLPTLLRDRGLDNIDAGMMTSTSIMAQTVTALLVPTLAAKRLSPKLLIVLVLASTGAGFFGLLYAPIASGHVWAFLLGLGQGGLFGLALLFISLRSPSPEVAAMLSGMSQSVGYLGASLCPFAVGLLRDVHHGPEWPSVLILAITLLCLRFGFQAARPGYVLAASEGSVRN